MNTSQTCERESTAKERLQSLVNEFEVARITGLSVASVRRLRLLRQGPRCIRIGAAVRYKPDAISAWLESPPSGGGWNCLCKGAIEVREKMACEIGDGGTILFSKMEPLPRPEWTSPIEVGAHARSFYSALPEQPTKAVFQALRDDPKLLSFLARHELGRLEFSGRVPRSNWLGWFDRQSRELVVNAFRAPETYGNPFYPPELPSVSAAGRDLAEAMQRSLYHELGHSILDVAGPEVERQAGKLLLSGRAMPVSIRARKEPIEYFCETFAAYRFEDGGRGASNEPAVRYSLEDNAGASTRRTSAEPP
jgi:predicted DNA-binding transcriptional regulator AlpA